MGSLLRDQFAARADRVAVLGEEPRVVGVREAVADAPDAEVRGAQDADLGTATLVEVEAPIASGA
jgi:hypothetical protein